MLDAWFATLATRLGVATESAHEEKGAPKELRQALDKVWTAAVSAAREDADRALEPERDRLVQQGLKLDIASQGLLQREVALNERGIALEHALELAKSQSRDQTAQLEKAGRDLEQARSSLANLVQERDTDRRQFDEQLRTLTEERQRIEQRASANEKRILEDVDRARQEAKQSARALEDAGRKHTTEKQSLERTNVSLSDRVHEDQVEVARLKERLRGAEERAKSLERALAAATVELRRTPKGRSDKLRSAKVLPGQTPRTT